MRTRKTLSQNDINIINGEIKRLQAIGKVSHKAGKTFVVCPFHPDNNPSCIITTMRDSKYQYGSFSCFGCGESGSWNKLAEAMGLQQLSGGIGDSPDKIVTQRITEPAPKRNVKVKAKKEVKNDLIIHEPVVVDDSQNVRKFILDNLGIRNPRPLPKDLKVWKTISRNMLRKIGTRIATHAEYDTEYLFLPCTVGGELVGGIRAAMEGSNVKVKYKNSTGAWSRSHGLFPYDTSVSVMLENENVFGQKVMVLTEGPRDSLYLMERGIPAVSILGTQSWSIEKRDLLLDMDADFILICMDGDVAGRKAEKKVYASLKELASCKKMNITMFNVTEGKELDPASSPDWLIDKIKKRLMKK